MPLLERYSDDLVRRVRARYEGCDLGPADAAGMTVEAIAAHFDVHPNSIWNWKARDSWQRPYWYTARRPICTAAPGRRLADLEGRLLAILRQAAIDGLPCPTNLALAKALGASSESVRHRLRDLAAAGQLTIESHGASRRVSLPDGQRTAETAHGGSHEGRARRPDLAALGERRSPEHWQRILVELKAAAAGGLPCPADRTLAKAGRCRTAAAARAFLRLESEGQFTVERRPNLRRIIFSDGTATTWPGQRRRGKVIDLCASDAVRALQRMDCRVFDVAVVTGKAWGVSWSIDGRIVGRTALVELAREKRAAAVEQLRSAA